jgi:hypothetical protein
MNTGKMLFVQVMDVLPWKTFQRIADRGISQRVARSTLADANERRDWRIYVDLLND